MNVAMLWFLGFFLVQCHHISFVDFVVLPSEHGRSVTDFWGWEAHEARFRCPDGLWVVIEEDVVPGGALNLNSINLPRPWSPRESSPSRKIPTVEPGIEPGTSWCLIFCYTSIYVINIKEIEEKLDGRYKEGHECKKPKWRPVWRYETMESRCRTR